MNKNIQIYLRVRPETVPNPDLKTTRVEAELHSQNFTFTRVFRDSSQQEVYAQFASGLLVDCMQGFDCVVFAYGQTGSGKTHTIQGNPTDPGLVPRTLCYLLSNHESVKMSFIEIYNEQLFDLFQPTNRLVLREHPCDGVYVENQAEIVPENYEHAIKLFLEAVQCRRNSATEMNQSSSRSHSIFTMTISNPNTGHATRIRFVDLAGSERLQSNDSVRKNETSNINRSLLCLGEVIKKLCRVEHVNFRDSKLTFLLRDSLAGHSKLAVIGTINPEQHCGTESLSTLAFLSRVAQIRSAPTQNSDVLGSIEQLKNKVLRLDAENQELKMRLHLETVLKEEKRPDFSKAVLQRLRKGLQKVMDRFFEMKGLFARLRMDGPDRKMAILMKIVERQELILKLEKERLENENFE